MSQKSKTKFQEELENYARRLGLHYDVGPDGPVNAEVLVIGEGGGESEAKRGIPFVGGAGHLLWNSLRKYGLHRANVYCTNVCKRQISLSRRGNERHVVHRDELDQWMGVLKWELSRLPNVRIVLVLGAYALEAITSNPFRISGELHSIPLEGITNWRGSVIDVQLPNGKTARAVLTINPAYAQRELAMEPPFLMDIKKLDLVHRGVFKEYEIEAKINPTAKEAIDYIRELGIANKPISFDIETVNLETACIGLTNNTHHGMCINFRDRKKNVYTLKEELAIREAFNHLCKLHTTQLVAQNGNFDTYWMGFKDRIKPHIWFDTLLAHHTLYPRFPHNLGFLVAQYTTHPYYKDEGKSWKEGGNIDQFWRYNVKDVCLTLACQKALYASLEKERMADFFFNHVMRLQPHLAEATIHGVKIDTALREQVERGVSEDVEQLKADFYHLVHEATGDPDYYPNPGSWQQLQELYFDVLSLKGRGRSTDATNRGYILQNPKTPPEAKEMIVAQDKWVKENKFLTTYVRTKIDDDDRMRCEYRQFGVTKAPGRLSSAKVLWGTGANLQNQPERARQQFIADNGCEFFYFDLSQAEARAVAYFANIEQWKEDFERARKDRSYDCHRALCSTMFKIPYDETPEKDYDPETGQHTTRYVAKRCRHGLNYRMQVTRLAEVTGLRYHEARQAFVLYHKITPELTKWWDMEERLYRRDKVIYNPFGRRFKVIQRITEEVLESIIAFKPQSTIGDKVCRVWYQSIEDNGWPKEARIALNVHDALVGMAPKKYTKTALRIMKKYAEEPITIQNVYKDPPEQLIIPAECKISLPDDKGVHRWSNLKEVEIDV